MLYCKVELPSAEARARLIGKDGAKVKDVEKISGTCLQISGKVVWISGPDKVAIELARRLIGKCIQHGVAANEAVEKQAEVQDVIRRDLFMAAHYTYRVN